MKKLLFFIVQLFLFSCLHSQRNGVYITEAKGFYRTPKAPDPQLEIIKHKFIISIDISSFSGRGQIVIRDENDGSVTTYNITAKVKDDYGDTYIAHVYWGEINLYGLTQATSIIFYDDPETKEMSNIVFLSVKFGSETHFSNLVPIEKTLSSTGSGFLISEGGYIVTNYHVVKGARGVSVLGLKNDFRNEIKARVEAYDEANDMAILKVSGITNLPAISYSILTKQSEVGESVFVLGYPLLSSMGYEVKLTDGLISSLSGFTGNSLYYQISSPVQPGNSGGPLFDSNGHIIGIVTAKLTSAENASYAIKSKLLLNFLYSKGIIVKNSVAIKNITPLSAKVKELKKYVVIVKATR